MLIRNTIVKLCPSVRDRSGKPGATPQAGRGLAADSPTRQPAGNAQNLGIKIYTLNISPANPSFYIALIILSIVLSSFLQSCSSKKESLASQGMQNLTAHFNILYNAGELFKTSSEAVEEAVPDDYARILSVYKEPTENASRSELKMLDSILGKTATIVGEKARSNYVDDAWFLTAKVNYMKSNFFNAVEYFDYVYKSYPDEKDLRQASLAWKARALIRLNELPAAADVLDTAIKYIPTSKKTASEVYAAEAQFNISSGNFSNAIHVLSKALEAGSSRKNEIRWTYILAQLEERNGLLSEAAEHYSAVVKSNTSFEMAFNANLNRIRLNEEEDGQASGRINRLESLLKQDKNKDFKDQIYYRIGDIYLEIGNKEQALKNYNLAIKSSTLNQQQRGLTYLKLAEWNFKEADYVKAKVYYDSTLMSLPPSYPGYEQIRTKSANLDFLAERYEVIAQQDTLRSLALMPEAKRELRVAELVTIRLQKSAGNLLASGAGLTPTGISGKSAAADVKYYFNNSNAISQGLVDFKKRWGNRKEEDNWRRSGAGSSMGSMPPDVSVISASSTSAAPAAESDLKKMYQESIPLTAAQMKQSDAKLMNAYYEIAGFYKDELKDIEEAQKTYQLLLSRFPGTDLRPAVYYHLYRMLANNALKATEYRNKLISEFPGSIYAKVLIDPDYAKKADERAFALNKTYTDIYNAYLEKDFQAVLALSSKAATQFKGSDFSSQFAYLQALATGRTQKLDVFEDSLKSLVNVFPNDKLITPLVKQHLAFINSNRDMLAKRTFALLDKDGTEAIFVEEPKPEPVKIIANTPVAANKQDVTALKAPEPIPAPIVKKDSLPAQTIVNNSTPVITPPQPEAKPLETIKPAELFSLPDSAEYYFIVNVNDARVNLNPSRFGIGQFNRSNYPSGKIVHQLKELNKENQLVLIGKFSSLYAVKSYEQHILPMMSSIMKIPAEKYNTFVITKAELDKLVNRNGLTAYIEFYRRR